MVRLAILVVGLALAFAAQSLGEALHEARARQPPSETHPFVPTPAAARFVSLGFNELAADLWWARTTLYYGDGMGKNLAMTDIEPLLALVNAFDPWFRRPYVWGSYAVTYRTGAATQQEFRSAIELLERGLVYFPKDWELLWILGQRYDLDMRSDDPAEQRRYKEMGADYMSRAARQEGAPQDLINRAAMLHSELGQKERALTELSEIILNTDDEAARAKLLARYRSIADEGSAQLLADAQKEFDAEWSSTLPFAPAALYVLVGNPPREPRLAEVLAGTLPGGQPQDDATELEPLEP